MQQGQSSIQFSQQELEYYQQLYSIANPAGTQSIDSISGGQFLVLSDLPRESLHEIWKIASANGTQGYLHVEGFFVACRLVAWAQSGIQIFQGCNDGVHQNHLDRARERKALVAASSPNCSL